MLKVQMRPQKKEKHWLFSYKEILENCYCFVKCIAISTVRFACAGISKGRLLKHVSRLFFSRTNLIFQFDKTVLNFYFRYELYLGPKEYVLLLLFVYSSFATEMQIVETPITILSFLTALPLVQHYKLRTEMLT